MREPEHVGLGMTERSRATPATDMIWSGKIGVDERPVPGASNAIVRDRRASVVSVPANMSTFAPIPLISRSGKPLPRSRTKISSPRTETVRGASAVAGIRGMLPDQADGETSKLR